MRYGELVKNGTIFGAIMLGLLGLFAGLPTLAEGLGIGVMAAITGWIAGAFMGAILGFVIGLIAEFLRTPRRTGMAS